MRGVLGRLHRGRAADDGSMLIELIVALVVFAVIATGLASLSIALTQVTSTNKARSIAANLAAKDLDVARAIGPQALTLNRTTLPSVTVGGTTFSMYRDVEQYAPGSTTCAVGAETSRYVTTTVSWTRKDDQTHTTTQTPVTASTILTATQGTFTQGTGSFGVVVTDQNGADLAGVPVYLVSGTGTTGGTLATTTDEGCATWDQLTPGTYTVYLGNSPTYVVPGFMNGVTATPPSSTSTVTGGTASNASFTYGKAANLTMDVTTDATHPVPANMPFTVGNTAFSTTTQSYSTTFTAAGTQSMYLPAIGSTGASGALTAASFPYLFPSSTGYSVWAGDCTDADPGASGGVRGTVATGPGASVTAKVPVVPFNLTLTGLTASKPLSVVVSHTTTTGVTCPNAVDTYKLAPSSTTTATTTGTSEVISAALPIGHWTFTSSCNSKTAVVTNVTWTGATSTSTAQAISQALSC